MNERNFCTKISAVNEPIDNTKVGENGFSFAVPIARQRDTKTNAHAYEKIDDVVSVFLS